MKQIILILTLLLTVASAHAGDLTRSSISVAKTWTNTATVDITNSIVVGSGYLEEIIIVPDATYTGRVSVALVRELDNAIVNLATNAAIAATLTVSPRHSATDSAGNDLGAVTNLLRYAICGESFRFVIGGGATGKTVKCIIKMEK